MSGVNEVIPGRVMYMWYTNTFMIYHYTRQGSRAPRGWMGFYARAFCIGSWEHGPGQRNTGGNGRVFVIWGESIMDKEGGISLGVNDDAFRPALT